MDKDETWHAALGLGPGYIVLDGGPSWPSRKGAPPPILSPYLLWPNDWMD